MPHFDCKQPDDTEIAIIAKPYLFSPSIGDVCNHGILAKLQNRLFYDQTVKH